MELWLTLLLALLALVFVAVVVLLCYAVARYGRISAELTPKERMFVDPANRRGVHRQTQFPSIFDCDEDESGLVELTLVVPAYKEEKRLPEMMQQTLQYLERHKERHSDFTYEVIIVDDGSTDGTTTTALRYVNQCGSDTVRVMTLRRNRGKGFAVRQGVLHSRGKRVLMVDADGATEIRDLQDLQDELDKMNPSDEWRDHTGFVMGSRTKKPTVDKAAKRDFKRNLAMHAFHMIVAVLMVSDIEDTQCGFKLFTRRSARLLFSQQHIDRWAFDVELCFLAHRLDVQMREVQVNWEEIPGGTIDIVWDGIRMALDMASARLMYTLSFWSIELED